MQMAYVKDGLLTEKKRAMRKVEIVPWLDR
jgi:hypothetical protein